ncbi:MAG: STAS domain-containing protein [Actinomycetota bacterium]|nr:STAS domain-containing protein [Actinomycetota bacterium]
MTNAADSPGWRTNPSAAESSTCPLDVDAAAGDRPVDSVALYDPARLLGLTVQHYPAVGICAVVVEGELDLLTVPLLEQRLRDQLVAKPAHLILDLEFVRFLGCSGLSCLPDARKLVQASGSQLHLSGLITRVVERVVGISGLLGVFSTYPTLLHAVIELADRAEVTTSDRERPVVLSVMWCCSVGVTWTLELRQCNGDTGLGELVDWISSGVPVTQAVPDMLAPKLLSARGLWLFRDGSPALPAGSRYRVGYASADAELISMAHLARDDAARAGVHPVMLSVWNMAGFSTAAAAGWMRAGCLFP